MARIVNKSQQVRVAGMNPAPAYSRIITVSARVNAGGGWAFGYSPSFGKKTRLLEVDVYIILLPDGANTHTHFQIFRGCGIPTRREDVETWDKIIDFGRYGDLDGMLTFGDWRHFSWDMNILYQTEANRFGLVLRSFTTNEANAYAFFQISEG